MLWLCIRLPALVRETLAASEREALERLAAWAYQWSSLVSYRPGGAAEVAATRAAVATARTSAPRPPLLWLELGASRTLFGEPMVLLERIGAELSRLGYSHTCAVAPSPAAAALLTRVAEGCCVLTAAQLHARLAPLPLTWLELPTETLEALRSAGLSSIGEVLALPAAALARRFGPQTCLYLARLIGTASEPLPAFQLPESYRARCEFDHELQETTGLLFPLQRLLQEFQGYLRARDCAVQSFTLELEHRPHTAQPHAAAVTRVTIGLSTSAREAARFLMLVRERLQNLVLEAPVRALTLTADAFTAPSIVQSGLFGSPAQQLGELSHLLDRLRARLGGEAVQGFQCQADHRPERTFALLSAEQARAAVKTRPAATAAAATAVAAAAAAATAAPARKSAGPITRPAALLPHPLRIPPPSTLLDGPERIESGWWDGAEVVRDYYVAHAASGVRQWVFQDRTDGAWYLHGLWV